MATIRVADLSLPKGGGAVRGLAADLQSSGSSGTANLSIALSLPKARALAPALNLVYDSGGGNGPYGAGASIALASIMRSTATGVPSYTSADILVFSETGILVEKGYWAADRWIAQVRTETAPSGKSWRVQTYIPQRDGAMPLIEQWTGLDDQISHWRVVSGDNIESLYGVSASARIQDPADPTRIFQWLLETVTDAKGNRAQYQYKTDDDAQTGATNRYIEKIRYGNYSPTPPRRTKPMPTNWSSTTASIPWKDWIAPAPTRTRRCAPGPNGPTRSPAFAVVSRSAPADCAAACSRS